MKKIKKVIKILFIIIIIFTIILNLCSKFNVSLFHFRIYRVVTGSMVPYLNVSDIILIKDDLNYDVGDVVTYEKDNIFITHRIVDIKDDLITTKGDANDTNDVSINEKDIVGKVVCKLKLVSLLVSWLERPVIWVLILFIGITIIFLLPKYRVEKGVIIDDEVI